MRGTPESESANIAKKGENFLGVINMANSTKYIIIIFRLGGGLGIGFQAKYIALRVSALMYVVVCPAEGLN